jgi:hypothetical protein
MMLHGYLSTIVMMHVTQGVDLPEEIKDEGYFLDLAGRPPAFSDGDESVLSVADRATAQSATDRTRGTAA